MKMKQPTLDIRSAIKKSREITEGSTHTYVTSLRQLYKNYCEEDEECLKKQLNSKFLHDWDKMKDIIGSVSNINTRKNRISAILVALSSEEKPDDKLIDKYQALLKVDNGKYQKFIDSQEKTQSQKKNWMSFDEVKEVLNKINEDIVDRDILKKDKLVRSEYNLLQKYVLLRVYLKYPMRNDVADMKVVTKSEYEDIPKGKRKISNYLIKGKPWKFQLNSFKNVKRIGPKSIDIDPKIEKILKFFLKHNTSGYLFTLTNGRDPLSSNGITKMMNSIFKKYADGRKISTSMLRHIQISDSLKDEPSIEEIKKKEKKTEDKYMHSSDMNQKYRKIN